MHVLWWHVANIPTGCSVGFQVRNETNESKLQASPQPGQITCQRCVPSGHSYWPPGCQQLVPAASLSSAAGTDDRNTPHKTDHAESHALETEWVDKATMCIGTYELSCSLCNVLMKSFSKSWKPVSTFSVWAHLHSWHLVFGTRCLLIWEMLPHLPALDLSWKLTCSV